MPWLGHGRGRPFYAVGGTLARASPACTWSRPNYPLHVMHGYAIPTAEAIDFCEYMRKAKKLSGLPGIEEIARPRREVLPYGALVLERLLQDAGARARSSSPCSASARGWSISLLSEHERRKDPLLSLLRRVCRACARARSSTPASCASGPTRCSSRPGPKETHEERRLRHAACLHLRHRLARAPRLPRRAEPEPASPTPALAGIDHPGRVFLALAIYFRHVGAGARSDGRTSCPSA